MFWSEIFNQVADTNDHKSQFFVNVVSQSCFPGFWWTNDGDTGNNPDVSWTWQTAFQNSRVSHDAVSLLLRVEVINPIPVHKGVTQNWAHQSERVQTAESTLSCDGVLHEVWHPMSLDCEHIVLLPTIDPLLKVGFDGEIDSVCHMLRLSITVDFDDINIPFLEGIN